MQPTQVIRQFVFGGELEVAHIALMKLWLGDREVRGLDVVLKHLFGRRTIRAPRAPDQVYVGSGQQ